MASDTHIYFLICGDVLVMTCDNVYVHDVGRPVIRLMCGSETTIDRNNTQYTIFLYNYSIIVEL